MAVDQRRRDVSWNVTDADGRLTSWDQVQVAVLMDIREELQRLNRIIGCPNFVAIPSILRAIQRTVPARRRRPRKA